MMINRGVQLNDWHSRDDLDLVMTGKTITLPSPKTEIVDIPAADGSADLSTILTDGDIKYENRTVTIELVALEPDRQKLIFLRDRILAAYHGQIVRATFDEDPDWYYTGRATVDYSEQPNVIEFTIEIDAEPYKYRTTETVYRLSIAGSQFVHFQNARKWTIPTFTASAEITAKIGTNSYTISSGTHILPEIVFMPGENIVKFEGTGTLTVTYQEGAL